jgi:hypothetical protein
MKPMLNICTIVFIALLLLNTGCYKGEEFDFSGIITLELIDKDIAEPLVDDGKLRADGVSKAIFKAHIDPDSTQKSITFSATSGTFEGAQNANSIVVPIDKNGDATATYIVGKVSGNVELVASVLSFRTVFEDFKLEPAHADNLAIESSSGFVSKSGAVMATIKAVLTRNGKRGYVSIGAPVDFSALQFNDQNLQVEVGRLINGVATDASGTASITFAADKPDVLVGRPVTIRVKAKKDNGEYVTKELVLNVIE